ALASKSAAIIATRGRHKNTASLPAEPMPYARLRAPTPSVERWPFQMMSTVDRLAGDSSATCVPSDATRMLREGRAILFIDLNAEMSQTEPAEQAAFHSPVPTQIVSNGEFNPLPQTAQQRRFE